MRSVIVVRALTKVDWGIASTFALSIQFVEMSANMNLERLLVQAPDGDDERFQRTAQLLRCVQGMLIAVVLFFLAPVLSDLFSVPEATWAYRLLALAPLANAFTHFDTSRFMRTLRYGADAMARAGSEVIALLIALILSQFITDYRLVLVVLLANPLVLALLTHILAERRYGWAWDGKFVKRLFAFGWPLTLNGFLMYLVVQGDRFLIGSAETVVSAARDWFEPLVTAIHVYDKADLAVYATAFSLCWMPVSFVTGTVGSLVFPLLSREQNDRKRFEAKYGLSTGLFSVFATLMAAGFIIGGTAVVVLIYKEDYRSVEGVIALIATMQAFRILRTGPTTAALALADSRILLWANVARSTSFLGGLWATLSGAHLAWIAAAGLGAEVMATAVAVIALRSKHGIGFGTMVRPLLFTVLGIGGAFAISLSGWYEGDLMSLVVTAVYLILLLGVAYLFFPRAAPMMREVYVARRTKKLTPRSDEE